MNGQKLPKPPEPPQSPQKTTITEARRRFGYLRIAHFGKTEPQSKSTNWLLALEQAVQGLGLSLMSDNELADVRRLHKTCVALEITQTFTSITTRKGIPTPNGSYGR